MNFVIPEEGDARVFLASIVMHLFSIFSHESPR